METPTSLEPHAKDFHNDAWKMYTPAELGQWVALLVKRSHHRKDPVKAQKDVYDAQNYLNMLQSHVTAAKVAAEYLKPAAPPS